VVARTNRTGTMYSPTIRSSGANARASWVALTPPSNAVFDGDHRIGTAAVQDIIEGFTNVVDADPFMFLGTCDLL